MRVEEEGSKNYKEKGREHSGCLEKCHTLAWLPAGGNGDSDNSRGNKPHLVFIPVVKTSLYSHRENSILFRP